MPAAPSFASPQRLLRSPDGLAKAVVILLVVAAVSDLLAVLAGLNVRSLLGDALDNGFATFDDAEADRADNLYMASGVLQLLVMLATGVVFILWFRRVRLNAEVFDASMQPRGSSRSPTWSCRSGSRAASGPRAPRPIPTAAGARFPRLRSICGGGPGSARRSSPGTPPSST
jgi:hypothetical protein